MQNDASGLLSSALASSASLSVQAYLLAVGETVTSRLARTRSGPRGRRPKTLHIASWRFSKSHKHVECASPNATYVHTR